MPVLKSIRILFLTAFLAVCAGCLEDQPIAHKLGLVNCVCIGVQDGDTITVLTRGKKQYRVRLAHIDCPEKGQPFGKAAKQFTSDFCYGKTVQIQYGGKKDRNGRVIGVVLNAVGENLNQALVRAGLAWHYTKYSGDQAYAQLESTARMKRIGLWQDPNPVAPWDWRRK